MWHGPLARGFSLGVHRPHLAPLVGPPLVGALSAYAPTVTHHPGQSATYLSGSYPAATFGSAATFWLSRIGAEGQA